MSDLRNYQSNDPQANRFGLDDQREPLILDNDAMHTPVFEDTGGLSSVHRTEEEWEEPGSKRNKIVSGLVVALLIGAAGAYTYANFSTSKQVVADNSLPKTAAIAPTPAPQPAPVAAPSAAPADTTATPAFAPEVIAPVKPTRSASTRSTSRKPQSMSTPAPVATPSTTPAENQAAAAPAPSANTTQNQAAATPEPVSPTPPAAAFAGNPAQGQQSAPADEAVAPAAQSQPEVAAPAAQPQPEAAAPAQPDAASPSDSQPATPAPSAPAQSQ